MSIIKLILIILISAECNVDYVNIDLNMFLVVKISYHNNEDVSLISYINQTTDNIIIEVYGDIDNVYGIMASMTTVMIINLFMMID